MSQRRQRCMKILPVGLSPQLAGINEPLSRLPNCKVESRAHMVSQLKRIVWTTWRLNAVLTSLTCLDFQLTSKIDNNFTHNTSLKIQIVCRCLFLMFSTAFYIEKNTWINWQSTLLEKYTWRLIVSPRANRYSSLSEAGKACIVYSAGVCRFVWACTCERKTLQQKLV